MYDVVIVGGGTVGLTLANLFSSQIKILLLEQNQHISQTFKATGIDDEVLRLFQQINISENIKNFIQTIEAGFPIFVFKDWNETVFLRLFQETGICGYNRGYVFCQEEIDKILFEKLKKQI